MLPSLRKLNGAPMPLSSEPLRSSVFPEKFDRLLTAWLKAGGVSFLSNPNVAIVSCLPGLKIADSVLEELEEKNASTIHSEMVRSVVNPWRKANWPKIKLSCMLRLLKK
ncbi:hypothetical protein GGP41_002191 [Bipolaris sorokiniana]|uniref:Uncharacterized protein n=1 Tax=Cochliobolus sativus TaxID=45130 RepID=A0A8H6DZD5_COCSA|nr:hypothetical protein GGP41_002191 [Bipolaris sorokiniana]